MMPIPPFVLLAIIACILTPYCFKHITIWAPIFFPETFASESHTVLQELLRAESHPGPWLLGSFAVACFLIYWA